MVFKISINFAVLINVFLIFSIIIYKIDLFSVPDVSIIEIGGGRSVSAASMGHCGQSG